MKKLICPTCRQNLNEPPQSGLNGKDCPQCGQGISWRRAALRKKIAAEMVVHDAEKENK